MQIKTKGNKLGLTGLLLSVCILSANVHFAYAQQLKVNDLGYLEARGVNVLVFSNEFNGFFFDEKTAGIELIHHGVRTATGGAVRLQNTPEQWDLVPFMADRKIDKSTNTIEVLLRYKELDFNSRISVTPSKEGFLITVYLDKPLPAALEGRAGFNLEFLPGFLFRKNIPGGWKTRQFFRYTLPAHTVVKPVTEKIPQFENHIDI